MTEAMEKFDSREEMIDIAEERIRFHSSILKRSFFIKIIEDCRLKDFKTSVELYDRYHLSAKAKYGDYIRYVYKSLLKFYRNEYVYKNELLLYILSMYRKESARVFSELRVGSSYADIALFNGISRVYEIKTEYDSPSRLQRQISNYKGFFQEIYIVTCPEMADFYAKYDEDIGVVVLSRNKGRVSLSVYKMPVTNTSIKIEVVMETLRRSEYIALVKKIYGYIPQVGDYEMYAECSKLLAAVEPSRIIMECNSIMKLRESYSQKLREIKRSNPHLLQMYLSLQISNKEYKLLEHKLNQLIFE